jgi:predicted XRE-type DNA-binding protein
MCDKSEANPKQASRELSRKAKSMNMTGKVIKRKKVNVQKVVPSRSEGAIKKQLITGVVLASEKKGLTHQQLAEGSGLPRSAVTGIISGSLRKVTIDRLVRLADAAGLNIELKFKK